MNLYFIHLKIISERNRRATGYHCTPLFKTGYWRATYCVRRATHGLPHKINEFLFPFIWKSFLNEIDGLPLYSFVQNGLLAGYLLYKTGYTRVTSQNQWICIFIHLKFISKQTGRATGLHCTRLFKTGNWQATYCGRRAINVFSTNKQYVRIKHVQNETNLRSIFLVKTKYW